MSDLDFCFVVVARTVKKKWLPFFMQFITKDLTKQEITNTYSTEISIIL